MTFEGDAMGVVIAYVRRNSGRSAKRKKGGEDRLALGSVFF